MAATSIDSELTEPMPNNAGSTTVSSLEEALDDRHTQRLASEAMPDTCDAVRDRHYADTSEASLGGNGVDTANHTYSDHQLSGRQSSADGNQQRLLDKVYVEVESVRGFNVRAKLIGTGGENMKYIQNTTGARVQVRGNGSGCDDNAPGSDPYEPLHLYITATSEEAMSQAKEYCSSLVETLHAQYHEFRDIGSRRQEPSSYRDTRGYDRDRHQSSRYRSEGHYSGRSQQSYYSSRQEYPLKHEYASQHAYSQAYQQQEYPQQGYSQPHPQTTPSGTADAAAYDEYAKYYAQYYQYYGTYPDQSTYYDQVSYVAPEQLAQDTYSQSRPQYPNTAAADTSNEEALPSNIPVHQNGYHSVPPPVDYSNSKV
ncbi:hypothetical protein GGI20_004514 [Coemansia sp. BCRC 34301]|nr:hypothetical protein GGI20_004514 [Coemansia sp. BCRC 34301]